MSLDILEDIGVGSGQEAITLCQQLLLVKGAGSKTRPNHAVCLALADMQGKVKQLPVKAVQACIGTLRQVATCVLSMH